MKTLEDLQRDFKEYYFPLRIEEVISHSVLRLSARILLLCILFLLFPAFGLIQGFEKEATLGVFLLSVIFVITILLDAVIYSFMWKSGAPLYSYECAELVFHAKKGDPLDTFLHSRIGKETIIRSGIDVQDLKDFLRSRHMVSQGLRLELSEGDYTIQKFLYALIDSYPDFSAFIATHEVSREDVWGACKMAIDARRTALQKERWWSKESLDAIEPIGREWAYGIAYYVERFCEKLRYDPTLKEELHREEVSQLSSVLSSAHGANALIVGDAGGGKMEIVEAYERLYRTRGQPSSFLVLRTDTFLSQIEDAVSYERAISMILLQIEKAGNIIFVIPDMPALIRRGNEYGVSFASLISPFMRSAHIHMIAIADTADFHTTIESQEELLRQFSLIRVKEPRVDTVFSYLYDEFQILEKSEEITLSFPALKQSVSLASMYMPTFPLYFAATDLLYRAIAEAKREGHKVVVQSHVLEILSEKTGVSHGAVDHDEKEILNRLEELLQARIIGQDDAIVSIANAMRRARAGITNPNRPLGSFLFLGPTGVGKTETAKALAEVFFGAEKSILRLDMSEYSSSDGMERLIGSRNVEGSGVLVNMIRDNQYGVLLLDEFEKTHESVHDLFLQILDEGMFRDAVGRKVNARNMIFIATSNAGSDMIRASIQAGISLKDREQEIVGGIIEREVFKAELVNRFDGVVLFHPLSKSELKEIALLLLERLQFRLKEKHITLVVNDALVDFLVAKGNDPLFGARPLTRAIQNSVESVIAKGMLEGKYPPGSTVMLESKDLL